MVCLYLSTMSYECESIKLFYCNFNYSQTGRSFGMSDHDSLGLLFHCAALRLDGTDRRFSAVHRQSFGTYSYAHRIAMRQSKNIQSTHFKKNIFSSYLK